ncbi:MAG TPA: hypothetical protein VGO93_16955, partial [Candidatus Xenobia bacterium]
MRALKQWATAAVLALGLWLGSGTSAQATPVFINITGINNQHCCGGSFVCSQGFPCFTRIGVDQIHGSDGFCLEPSCTANPTKAIRLFQTHQLGGPCTIAGNYNPQLCSPCSKAGGCICLAPDGFFGCSIPTD